MFALFREIDFRPRYNIAPTTQVVAVRLVEPSKIRQADMLRWGLVPFWSKDPKAGPPMINARADTVRTKPSFRSAFKARRCLMPMSGFYEWSTIGKAKQPYHVEMKDRRPFAVAALWESWGKDDNVVESCALITTDPNPLMAEFHDRMPVIVPPEEYDRWLQGTPDEAAELLTSYPAEKMTAVPVSTIVNSVRNDVPECIEPLNAPA